MLTVCASTNVFVGSIAAIVPSIAGCIQGDASLVYTQVPIELVVAFADWCRFTCCEKSIEMQITKWTNCYCMGSLLRYGSYHNLFRRSCRDNLTLRRRPIRFSRNGHRCTGKRRILAVAINKIRVSGRTYRRSKETTEWFSVTPRYFSSPKIQR